MKKQKGENKKMNVEEKFKLSQFCLLVKAGYGATDRSPGEIQLRQKELCNINKRIKFKT